MFPERSCYQRMQSAIGGKSNKLGLRSAVAALEKIIVEYIIENFRKLIKVSCREMSEYYFKVWFLALFKHSYIFQLRTIFYDFVSVSRCCFNSSWRASLTGGVFGHAVWLSRRVKRGDRSCPLPKPMPMPHSTPHCPLPTSIGSSIRPFYDLQIFKYASPAAAGAAVAAVAALAAADCATCLAALGVRWLIAAGSREPLDSRLPCVCSPNLRPG